MKPLGEYNDDLTIEHYDSASRIYLGEQRRGIIDDHPEASSLDELAKQAITDPFFLAQKIPLPRATLNALNFSLKGCHSEISSFWPTQLTELTNLAQKARPTEELWRTLIPDDIKPAAGRINAAALFCLMQGAGLKGPRWIRQLISGFPLVGTLSQKSVYPVDPKVDRRPELSPNRLFDSSRIRFEERAAKAGWENALALWKDASEQQQSDWLTPPFPLRFSSSKSCTIMGRKLNIAFRFGVSQGEKLRACGDLRHSLTSLACSIMTPIKLVSWDHVAELCRLVSSSRSDWQFLKAGHEAAYKQLPLKPSRATLAAIALRSPSDKRRYGFLIRTMMFGAVAAVLHYNAFSRTLAELANFYLGIPLLSFFDDFGALTPSSLTLLALKTFTSFCSLLGIKLKSEKSDCGPRLTFLGIEGYFPCKANGMRLRVPLPETKAQKWAPLLQQVLTGRKIGIVELESLIGKLSFSQTCLFGKFARTQLRPLYKKLHGRFYSTELSSREHSAIRWWLATIKELRPRIAQGLNSHPDLILFTDAATSNPLIAGVLFKPRSTRAIQLTTGRAPSAWLRRFNVKNKIFGPELLAPLAFIWSHQDLMRGKACTIYLDSNNALAALLRGDSCDSFVVAMVAFFWKLVQKLGMAVWLGRVKSKLNVADLPTRNLKLPYQIEHTSEFKRFLALLKECLFRA